jgi:hypothetical protein
MILVSNKQQH